MVYFNKCYIFQEIKLFESSTYFFLFDCRVSKHSMANKFMPHIKAYDMNKITSLFSHL